MEERKRREKREKERTVKENFNDIMNSSNINLKHT